MQSRKYMALTPIVLGLIIFVFFTMRVAISWITLPPFSIEVEGQYVGFYLLLLMYAYALPISCALCLAGYLVNPPVFHRLRTPINLLAAFFTVLGVAALMILPLFALLRNISVIILVIGFMAPYIIVPILAYNVYIRSRTPSKISDTEPFKADPKAGHVTGIVTLIGGALMVASQLGIVPTILMWVIMFPTYPPVMQPSTIQFMLFMIFYTAIPIAIGFVVMIAGSIIYGGDMKVGGLLAIAFAIQSFSTFGISLVLGGILALIGGALAYLSKEAEYGA
jgi:hypothetical protein